MLISVLKLDALTRRLTHYNLKWLLEELQLLLAVGEKKVQGSLFHLQQWKRPPHTSNISNNRDENLINGMGLGWSWVVARVSSSSYTAAM